MKRRSATASGRAVITTLKGDRMTVRISRVDPTLELRVGARLILASDIETVAADVLAHSDGELELQLLAPFELKPKSLTLRNGPQWSKVANVRASTTPRTPTPLNGADMGAGAPGSQPLHDSYGGETWLEPLGKPETQVRVTQWRPIPR